MFEHISDVKNDHCFSGIKTQSLWKVFADYWLLFFFSNIYMHLQGCREYRIFWHCKANKIIFFKKNASLSQCNFYSTIEWSHLHQSLLLNAVDEEMACKNYEDDFFFLPTFWMPSACCQAGRVPVVRQDVCLYVPETYSFFLFFLSVSTPFSFLWEFLLFVLSTKFFSADFKNILEPMVLRSVILCSPV